MPARPRRQSDTHASATPSSTIWIGTKTQGWRNGSRSCIGLQICLLSFRRSSRWMPGIRSPCFSTPRGLGAACIRTTSTVDTDDRRASRRFQSRPENRRRRSEATCGPGRAPACYHTGAACGGRNGAQGARPVGACPTGVERKLQGRRTSSRLPALIDLVMARPLVSAAMVGETLGVTQQAARRIVADLGLREMTGRGRFRAWGFSSRDEARLRRKDHRHAMAGAGTAREGNTGEPLFVVDQGKTRRSDRTPPPEHQMRSSSVEPGAKLLTRRPCNRDTSSLAKVCVPRFTLSLHLIPPSWIREEGRGHADGATARRRPGIEDPLDIRIIGNQCGGLQTTTWLASRSAVITDRHV